MYTDKLEQEWSDKFLRNVAMPDMDMVSVPFPLERLLLLESRPEITWESKDVGNPGVVRMPDNTINMVYRCRGDDGLRHIGFCKLDPDGRAVIDGSRGTQPLIKQSPEDRQLFQDGYADPRLNKVGEWYYILATGRNDGVLAENRRKYDNDFSGQYVGGRQIAAFRTKDFKNVESLGLCGPDEFDKNAYLHPSPVMINGESYFAMFHRIQFSIQVALAMHIEDFRSRHFWKAYMARLSDYIFALPIFGWEGVGSAQGWPGSIAGGAPPVEIDPRLLGQRQQPGQRYWLMFYNASGPPRKGAIPGDRVISALIYTLKSHLSLGTQPFEVVARAPMPLLRPQAQYELGSPNGDVVFATGALLSVDKKAVDIFFGSGDIAVSKARFDLRELVGYMRQFDAHGRLA